jgi:putative ABC transport system ATP-binding protein
MSTPAAHTVAVRTRGIDMFFGDGETKVTALKQADFEANRGELIMLVGPSGCGKTTLLSVIAGTLTPQTGTVEVFGQRLDGLSQEELTTFRRKHLGFVFQSFNLIPTLTVLENVMVPLLIQGTGQAVAVAKARAMLEKVGLKGREEGRPNALSGGQQQRVAIARALVHEPSLLICDEPTSALDKDTGAQIMQMVRDLSRSPDRCVVVVTHDHRIFRFADRIAEMEDGRIRRVVEDASLLDTNHL